MRLRYIFLISFLVSLFFTPLIKRLSFKFNLLDIPNQRKMHKTPTPILGGVAVYLATVLALSSTIFSSAKIFTVFLAGSLVFIMNLINDIKAIPAAVRLVVEIIPALILIYAGIYIEFFPRNTIWFILNYLLTIIWIVGIINAVNYLDGLNGLLCLLTISMLSCFAYIGFISNQFWLLTVIVALGGAIFGFLKYNFPDASIFLGDSGSTFIGFILAAVSILGSWAEDNVVKIFVPVFILGVPIFDMCFTTFMRIKEGKVKNVLKYLAYAGKDHFHHRLLNLGLGPKGVVSLICVVALALGISGVVLYNSERLDVYFMLLQAFSIFVVISILMVLGEKIENNYQ